MIREVHEAIARALEARTLDHRTCFVEVNASPPDAASLVIECSDAGVLQEIRRRLASTGVSEGRLTFIALPEGSAMDPGVTIASASVVDVRRGPAHAAELVSQVILGDSVMPLKQSGEWTLVRLEDGYVGWVRSWHLHVISRTDHAAFEQASRHRVGAGVALVFDKPSQDSLPVSDVVMGTPVVSAPCGRRGWREVKLPDLRTGFVRSTGIENRPIPGLARRNRTRMLRSMASTALKMLGVPYVWGGTTPKGFDCSGLTQRVYRLHGIVIPRDSDMQARHGSIQSARADALRIGDLLFFGRDREAITHVALFLGDGLYVHARGHVRLNSLTPSHPLFDRELSQSWQLAGRPLSD